MYLAHHELESVVVVVIIIIIIIIIITINAITCPSQVLMLVSNSSCAFAHLLTLVQSAGPVTQPCSREFLTPCNAPHACYNRSAWSLLLSALGPRLSATSSLRLQ